MLERIWNVLEYTNLMTANEGPSNQIKFSSNQIWCSSDRIWCSSPFKQDAQYRSAYHILWKPSFQDRIPSSRQGSSAPGHIYPMVRDYMKWCSSPLFKYNFQREIIFCIYMWYTLFAMGYSSSVFGLFEP